MGRTLDWNLLDRLGARANIDIYLTQEFHTGNLTFTCSAWKRALNLREPICKELVIEFIASYEFDEDTARRDSTSRPIKYRLGGQWQELSVVNLAVHLGLYIEEEVRHRAFQTFLDRCALWKSDQTNLSEIWAELGLGPFSAPNTKVRRLKYPDHRVIHQMLVNTVHQRKSSHDKVDNIDLWLLEQIVNDNCFTNVPFVSAKMFIDARGYIKKSSLLFGQYITRLTRSHGVLSERVVNSFT